MKIVAFDRFDCKQFSAEFGNLYKNLNIFSLENAREEDPDHQALCDLAPSVSCTAAFESEYGTGFGIICPIVGEDHILLWLKIYWNDNLNYNNILGTFSEMANY